MSPCCLQILQKSEIGFFLRFFFRFLLELTFSSLDPLDPSTSTKKKINKINNKLLWHPGRRGPGLRCLLGPGVLRGLRQL